MTDSFPKLSNETIFSNSTLSLSENDDDLISDKVFILADGIYQEFENLIKKFGHGTVDGLMPIVVTILETMDKLYNVKDDLTLQLDLIKEDQSQLYTQYEREKVSRMLAEEKINNIEDLFEDERQHFENRVEILESANKLADMKLKNCRDLNTRILEKEAELRKDYANLQQRYSELLRSKVEHMHRHVHSSQCAVETLSSGCQSPQLIIEKKRKSEKIPLCHANRLEPDLITDERMELSIGTFLRDQIQSVNELSLRDELAQNSNDNHVNENLHAQSTLDPMLELDINEVSEMSSDVHNINIESDDLCLENEFDDLDMSREIENLIKENQDLMETKNALNIVKDDLITQLDELMGQLSIQQDELQTSNDSVKKHKARVYELEKKVAELSQHLKDKEAKLLEFGEDENSIECSVQQNGVQTKTRYTRVEVARILLERNKYKEELLELQETMRYHMSVMKGNEKKKTGSLWKFFGNILSNATAFTTEAFIGSGNEMTVTHLNRTFAGSRNNPTLLSDDNGTYITLPNLSNQSHASKKRPTPGVPIRVPMNVLFSPLQDHDQLMVNLVPLEEDPEKSFRNSNAIDNSSL